jgi:glycine cleavage system H protein
MSDLIEQFTVEDDVLVMSVGTNLFKIIGDLKEVDLPEEGNEVDKGEDIITLTGTDEEIHLRSPIAGIIVEVNDLFQDNLSSNRKKTSHKEWIIKIEPHEVDELLSFED